MADPNLVADGDDIVADWGNAIANRVTNVFASSGARGAAMSAPFTGQMTYLASGDLYEGLQSYNSASQWALPPNIPHGHVGSGYSSSTVTSVDLTKDIVSVTVTAYGHRYLRVQGAVYLGNATVNTEVGLHLYVNASAATSSLVDGGYIATGGEVHTKLTCDYEYAGLTALGSVTFSLRAAPVSGTVDAVNATMVGRIWVTDMGPSGSPA